MGRCATCGIEGLSTSWPAAATEIARAVGIECEIYLAIRRVLALVARRDLSLEGRAAALVELGAAAAAALAYLPAAACPTPRSSSRKRRRLAEG